MQGSWSVAVATLGPLVLAAGPAAAQSSSTKSQQDEAVRFIFQRYDANNDGNITDAEFQKVGQEDFASFDTNKDGIVSRAEYLAPEAHGAHLTGDQLAQAQEIWGKQFDFLDTDKNGKVTHAEHDAASTRSFQRLDGNKDGRITLAELEAAAAK